MFMNVLSKIPERSAHARLYAYMRQGHYRALIFMKFFMCVDLIILNIFASLIGFRTDSTVL